MFTKLVRPCLIILCFFCLSACALATNPLKSIPPSATASPVPPTSTPVPTVAPTVTPSPTITRTPTPLPTATPDVKATRTAVAQATEAALSAMVKSELEKMELPSEGRLAWVSSEIESLTVTEYYAHDFIPVNSAVGYKNFILKTDITWNSTSGLAGCGIAFRADTYPLNNSSFFSIFLVRLSGAPAWQIEYYKDGDFMANLTGNTQFTKIIDVKPGSTNTYYLVVNGDQITLFANGKRLGSAKANQLDHEGYLAWYVHQESGKTTCSFNHGWLWELP